MLVSRPWQNPRPPNRSSSTCASSKTRSITHPHSGAIETDQRRGWHLLRSGPLGLTHCPCWRKRPWKANRWGAVWLQLATRVLDRRGFAATSCVDVVMAFGRALTVPRPIWLLFGSSLVVKLSDHVTAVFLPFQKKKCAGDPMSIVSEHHLRCHKEGSPQV